jgi:carbon storage regulator
VLVLTRRANQSIMIGDDVVVTVLEVRGDQVRLGIKAPRSIDVHREEIFVQLQQGYREPAPLSSETPSSETVEKVTDLGTSGNDAAAASSPS